MALARLILPAVLCASSPVFAQTYNEIVAPTSTYYRQHCVGPCDCVDTDQPHPLTGTFVLTFDHSDMWTDYYTVTQVALDSSTQNEPSVHFAGSGTYHIGGDFALTHRLTLDLLQVGNPLPLHFDSGEVVISGSGNPPFPAVSIAVTTGDIGCSRWTFEINAAPGGVSCRPDIGQAGGMPGADGELNNNDFIAFINAFFNGAPEADCGSAGGVIGSDGQFDNNDFIAFITLFFQGC
jgi:hypothetical protein